MIALLGVGGLIAPAFAAQPARPGTVNYVEGAAFLDGQPLRSNQIGDVALDAGQELSTAANGKAEVLLTPGVFLRIGSNSMVKLVSPDLTLTQVALEKGEAAVEVDEIHDQNDLQLIDAGVTTRLDKTGYYEFDANHPEAMVFKGMAKTEVADGTWREIKGSHELLLDGNSGALAKAKPVGFNADQAEGNDQLYKWSRLRSQYLAEANNQMAGEYYGEGYYPGWYWAPGWGYTFIGAGPFYSPFGWGFYPLGWGWYGGWGGRGFYGGRFYGGRAFVGGGFHGGGFAGGGRR
jgi:hypothetical protein